MILAATMIAGVTSYVVTWLVPHQVGIAQYATFAVFWSFIYLVVGALFGVQQEVARASSPTSGSTPVAGAAKARNFGLGFGAIVFLVTVASAPAWVNAAFPVGGWSFVWPLAVGTASFVMVAVLCGSLYGVARWRELAMLMVTDAVLRLTGIAIVLGFTSSTLALAWAVAAPFPLTLIVLWPFVRRAIVGKSQLDVGYRAISWNVTRTIVAAASTGLMVSGFPLLLNLTSPVVSKAELGLVILSTTLCRAPLIVVAMSLQSYFIVTFRQNKDQVGRTLIRLIAAIAVGGIVLAGLGWLVGPPIFALLFPAAPSLAGWFVAVLILSSALVAALCVSAPAVLAQSAHLAYSAGWVAGALASVVSLLLPLDFMSRTVVALFAGPCVGLAVHSGYFLLQRIAKQRVASSSEHNAVS